jgi:hypothetical protein
MARGSELAPGATGIDPKTISEKIASSQLGQSLPDPSTAAAGSG